MADLFSNALCTLSQSEADLGHLLELYILISFHKPHKRKGL